MWADLYLSAWGQSGVQPDFETGPMGPRDALISWWVLKGWSHLGLILRDSHLV